MNEKTHFDTLKERLNNDSEKLVIHELKDRLNMRDNDKMWAIFVGLDYYLDLYKRIPDKLKMVCDHLDKKEKDFIKTAENKSRVIGRLEAQKSRVEQEALMQKMLERAIKKTRSPIYVHILLITLTAFSSLIIGAIATLFFVKSHPAILNLF